MSWGEVYKINNNMKRSINEQLRDLKFQEIKIITSSGTYTPTKTGLYKVICVGAGGNGYCVENSSTAYGSAAGGGGGVAISTLTLSSSVSYTVTVSSTASFVYSDEITLTATSGGVGVNARVGGSGGTASGGDNNYTGTSGNYTGNMVTFTAPVGGGVSVYISDLSYTPYPIINTLIDTSGSSNKYYTLSFNYGDCLLGYGGGGTGAVRQTSSTSNYPGTITNGRPAAIIIIPLELEE